MNGMVFSRRMAALAAVVLIPLGIAATSFALTDSPPDPKVPAKVELESGSPSPTPARPEPTPSDQVVSRPPVTDSPPDEDDDDDRGRNTGTTPPPTEPTTTGRATTADRGEPRERRRVTARVRILLWLLLVMAVALASVAATTRSILLRDTDQRINGLLAQEAAEFANFQKQGFDPETGRPFTEPKRLLEVFLQRQYADLDEELIGLVGEPGGDPAHIVQQREIPVDLPLHRDSEAERRIYASPSPPAPCTGRRARSAGPRSSWRGTAANRRRPSWSPSTRDANRSARTRCSGSCWPSPASPC